VNAKRVAVRSTAWLDVSVAMIPVIFLLEVYNRAIRDFVEAIGGDLRPTEKPFSASLHDDRKFIFTVLLCPSRHLNRFLLNLELFFQRHFYERTELIHRLVSQHLGVVQNANASFYERCFRHLTRYIRTNGVK
jgi:hypothetical protein